MKQHDVNAVKPQTLNHLVGNTHGIEQVRVALDAAQMDNRRKESGQFVKSTAQSVVFICIHTCFATPLLTVIWKRIVGTW